MAVLVSSTTTQTTTAFLTLTQSAESTRYETATEVSSVQTMTTSTYITTKVVAVPVQIVTAVVSVYSFQPGGGWVTRTTTRIRTVVVYSPAYVLSSVRVSQSTNVPTTVFSTTASTSTYATEQIIGMTKTQTITSVTDVQPPASSISDMLTQNWWILLVLGAALAVLAFSLGRRSRSRLAPALKSLKSAPYPIQGSKPEIVYCMSCGAQNPATAEFCGKCGTKL
jgi:glucan phosphoethanolaminetransferase (alkaline phosphatase superfamily)